MSLSVQFFSLLAMIGVGIVAASVIDLIGTSIASSRQGALVRKYATAIEIIGWIVVGSGAFFILYIVRDGAWRIYDPFAQVSGLLLYVSFFHRPFRFTGRIFLLLFIKPIWRILTAVFLLIKSIFILIMRLLQFIGHPFISIFRKLPSKYFKSNKK